MNTTSLKQKIYLILFGICSTAVLIEFILNISGWIYNSHRIKVTVSSRDVNATRILCVGDSFVFGIGSKKGYSFPEQLQTLFDKNTSGHKSIMVVNCGIPSQNSSQLLNNLPNLIERLNPNIIVVLIGMNDYWNLQDSTYYLFTTGIKSYIYRIDASLTKSKSYKLLKMLFGSVRNKFFVFFANDKKNSQQRNTGKNKEIIKDNQLAIKEFALGKEYWNSNNRESSLAIEKFEKSIEYDPDFLEAYIALADCYAILGKSSLAIDYLKKAIEIAPYSKEARNALWKIYWQTEMNELAMKEIKTAALIDPENENLKLLAKTGLPPIREKVIFRKILYHNLKSMIKLIESYKIDTVLVDYPRSDDSNSVLKEISEEFNLLFVDNERIFENLSHQKAYKAKDYFANDNCHCNGNGYYLMAKNIYEIIQNVIRCNFPIKAAASF